MNGKDISKWIDERTEELSNNLKLFSKKTENGLRERDYIWAQIKILEELKKEIENGSG